MLVRLAMACLLSLWLLTAQPQSDPPAPVEGVGRNAVQEQPPRHEDQTENGQLGEGVGAALSISVDEPETQGDTQDGSNKGDHESHRSAAPGWDIGWDRMLILGFTGTLAVVAVLQCYLAWQMYVSTHRPRLRVRNVYVPDIEAFLHKSPNAEFQPVYEVANVGGTAATLTVCSAQIVLAVDAELRHYQIGLPQQLSEEIVIPHGAVHSTEVTPKTYHPDMVARFRVPAPEETLGVRANNLDAYCIGYLRYKDRLGVERQLRFCRKFNRTTQRFVPVDDSDYEYED